VKACCKKESMSRINAIKLFYANLGINDVDTLRSIGFPDTPFVRRICSQCSYNCTYDSFCMECCALMKSEIAEEAPDAGDVLPHFYTQLTRLVEFFKRDPDKATTTLPALDNKFGASSTANPPLNQHQEDNDCLRLYHNFTCVQMHPWQQGVPAYLHDFRQRMCVKIGQSGMSALYTPFVTADEGVLRDLYRATIGTVLDDRHRAFFQLHVRAQQILANAKQGLKNDGFVQAEAKIPADEPGYGPKFWAVQSNPSLYFFNALTRNVHNSPSRRDRSNRPS